MCFYIPHISHIILWRFTILTVALKSIQKELNTNVFILQAVQNSLIEEFLECFECYM